MGDHCRMNLNENLVNCDSFTSAFIGRICGAKLMLLSIFKVELVSAIKNEKECFDNIFLQLIAKFLKI